MGFLQDLYNGKLNGKSWSMPSVLPPTQTRQLPYGAGTYSAAGTQPAQISPTPIGPMNNPVVPPSPVVPPAPVAPAPVQQQTQSSALPRSYINPTTGQPWTPQEYVDNVLKTLPVSDGSDIGTYAGNAIMNPNQSAEKLMGTARNLNNTRNDIAVGETDPYGTATGSKIVYSPAQLAAIEKAYAGIYDPAINDVLNKLEIKQKEDAAAADRKFQLEKMAKEHEYTMAEKGLTGGSSSSSGAYVRGADPIVDGWVDKINRTPGATIESMIPGVANQGLRNKVMLGLNATKYDTAQVSGNLQDINTINSMLQNAELDNISGGLGQYKPMLFGQAKTAKTQYDQIVGALQLAKAGQIKGQGQISDYERKVLKEASAAVDRGMSDEEFRKALVKLRGVLMTSSGMEAPIKVTSPSGETITSTGNTEEINNLIREGNLVEYIEQ